MSLHSDFLDAPNAKRTELPVSQPTSEPPPHQILSGVATASTTTRKDGSTSQQRQGHIVLRHSILSHAARMAQDYTRPGRRPNLQARKEGCDTVADWCRAEGLAWYCASQGCHWCVFEELFVRLRTRRADEKQVTRFCASSSRVVRFNLCERAMRPRAAPERERALGRPNKKHLCLRSVFMADVEISCL